MTLALGNEHLTIADVVAVARNGAPAYLSDPARSRLDDSRRVVEEWSREDKPAYGLTRGLGGRATMNVAAADRETYSEAVVLARASGAGGYFEADVVRAALFTRAAGLANGGAGVRPVIVDTQLAMLDRRVHPLVPKVGSVGASDLMLCANLALPLMGQGRAEFRGRIMAGAEAMGAAGLEPVRLLEREGLALCSSNAVAVGLGALVLHDLIELVELEEAIVALCLEAFRGNISPIDPRVVEARPAPGQREAAAALRGWLDGSALFEPGEARRVQDPISLRCASHVLGALRAGIDFARPNVEVELNAAADNPLVLLEEREILSTGNFHTPAMSIAFDALRLALGQAGTMASQRTARMMDPEASGLPAGLSQGGVTRFGLGLIALTATTLAREMRYLACPVANDDSGMFGVEDHAPMTPVAVRRTHEQLDLFRQVLACELIVATQALELRGVSRVAPVARRLAAAVREVVPPLADDRSTTAEVEVVADLIRSGAFSAAAQGS